MDCNEVKVQLYALMDNEVTDSEREKLLSHIAECDDCKKEYEELKAMKNEFRKLDVKLDGALADSTMKKIYAKAYPQKKNPFLLKYMGTAAALIIIAGMFIFAKLTPQKDSQKENVSENKPIKTLQLENASFKDGSKNNAPKPDTGAETESVRLPKEESTDVTNTNTVYDTEDDVFHYTEAEDPFKEESKEEANDTSVSDFEKPTSKAEASEESIQEDVTPGQAMLENSLPDFRLYNSIAPNTAIIFVDSEMSAVTPLFDNIISIGSNCINLEESHTEVMNILFSNSITVTSTDIPNNTDSTIVFVE